MAEVIKLDPSAVADSRTEVDISDWVRAEGIDWGDSEITSYMAEGERGSAPVDYRLPNRTITIPLVLKTVGATTFAQIREKIQAKAALFQREGGWASRTTATGTYYLDIVNATLKLSGGWLQAHRDADIEAVLTLEAIPDFYGDEVSLTDHSETTLPCLVGTDTGIDGDYPARVRLVVDEDDADDQMFVMFGVQSRYYNVTSGTTTSKLFYEAEALTAMGGAAGTSTATGSGGSLVKQSTLTPTYQAMLSTQLAGGGSHLSHIGTYRMWARTRRPTTNTGEVSVALEWGEGDFRKRTLNDPVTYVADDREGDWCLSDLGLVSPAKVAQGTQKWEGRVVAKSTVTGDDLDVDCLMLFPVDEGYGEIRGAIGFEIPTSFSARDEFEQSAGNLNAKTAPVGGAWATSGATTDLAVEATSHTLQRSASSGARFAVVGSSVATVATQVDVTSAEFVESGLLVRYVDASNYAYITAGISAAGFSLVKVIAGVPSTIAFDSSLAIPGAEAMVTQRVYADAAGRFAFWFAPQGQALGSPFLDGQDAVFATGGVLASGKVGIRDHGTGGATRVFDNFASWAPVTDAAVFASQSLEIRHDRAIREDSAGAIWTPVTDVKGDYLRLPPAGLEGRSTRFIVKASRNDPDSGTDPAMDNISARAHGRPSWLIVPG